MYNCELNLIKRLAKKWKARAQSNLIILKIKIVKVNLFLIRHRRSKFIDLKQLTRIVKGRLGPVCQKTVIKFIFNRL